ncbi:MAG: hypothetical protein ACT4OS_11185 [Acidimicrobiales bacterium]
MLAALENKPGRVVLVDLGGGVMTVARGDESQIDALVVVVEPYPRSLEVGRRLLDMATTKNISRRVVVANKITDAQDLRVVVEFLGAEPDWILPQDDSVRTADRLGASPIDHDSGSVAVAELRKLASALVEPTARNASG